jgi:hypothetical protein
VAIVTLVVESVACPRQRSIAGISREEIKGASHKMGKEDHLKQQRNH